MMQFPSLGRAKALFVAGIALCFSAEPARSQDSLRNKTAAEAAYGIRFHAGSGLIDTAGYRVVDFSGVEKELVTRSARWSMEVARTAGTGLQLDGSGELFVMAGADDKAQQQFAARLATSGLSDDDRAYTCLLAAKAFGGDAKKTERMKIALKYLALLDAQPPRAAQLKLDGHSVIGESYYMAGNSALALQHFQSALRELPALPFEWRKIRSAVNAFLLAADILSGMPRGREQLDSTGQWVLAQFKAPAEVLAKDPKFKYLSLELQAEFRRIIAMTDHLGRMHPDVIANYWWNTPIPSAPSPEFPGAAVRRFEDGKIRVVMYGNKGCAACMTALPELEQYRKTVPANVEIWFYTKGADLWGATAMTAPEATRYYQHYFLVDRGVTFPIAYWVGRRVPDINGGTALEECPTYETFSRAGTPRFIVTDGTGRIRHTSLGWNETIISRVIKFLVAEAAVAPSRTATPTTVSQQN